MLACVSEFAIVAVPQDRLDDLEPLWRVLYEHHRALTPHLRDRERAFEQAWPIRRRIEREWLATEPRSFVLAAHDSDRYVGYAFVRVRSTSTYAASWNISDPLADLATLAILPELRGRRIGPALLEAVEVRLQELGIGDMAIDVVTTNTDAIRFYERRGAVPFVTTLIYRVFDHRQADDAATADHEAPTTRRPRA
jgi:ribosomal protein S18 acetylase RimI-like enzyme